MNNDTKAKLIEFVETLNDGIHFYTKAKGQINRNALAHIFEEMIQAKVELKNKLAPWLRLIDIPGKDDMTVRGKARMLYTELAAKLPGDSDDVYIANLEEIEDRVLDDYTELFEADLDSRLQTILVDAHRQAQMCHDRMKTLKEAA